MNRATHRHDEKKQVDRCFRTLGKELGMVSSSPLVEVKRLGFESMYGRCYRLCLKGHGKRLLALFRRALARAVTTQRASKSGYELRARMICDIFMYCIRQRFGGHVDYEIDASEAVDSAWQRARHMRRSRTCS